MDITPNQPNFSNTPGDNQKVNDALSIMLNIQNQEVEVKRSQVNEMAKKFAEIAYQLGETNEPDEYAETMTETIYSAWKKVKKKRDEKNKKNR